MLLAPLQLKSELAFAVPALVSDSYLKFQLQKADVTVGQSNYTGKLFFINSVSILLKGTVCCMVFRGPWETIPL